MFDFAWSELALIGIVALVVIGPKDLPVAIKAVSGMIKKARRMAGEFQTHVDEMVKDANLDEVRSQINQIRNFDIKGEIERAVDTDGSLKSTFSSDPFATSYPNTLNETAVSDNTVSDTTVIEAPAVIPPEEVRPDPALLAIPAFIPPEIASPPLAPAFIPPGVTRAS
jgi:sec-independent protein translocase protein TatB